MSRSSASLSPSLGSIGPLPNPLVWVIVGASRGIGREFVRQLLLRGDRIFAVIRDPANASDLWAIAGSSTRGRCELLECDIANEESVVSFARDLVARRDLDRIDYLVLNAGILKYPNRATEISFDLFADHLRTNTIGPVITAQKLLETMIPIRSIVFISSDSGSATKSRQLDDGFAVYAASKAALNHVSRHLAVELQKKKILTAVIAMHPGEVNTYRSNVDVEGLVSMEQSVAGMIQVIQTKNMQHTGTFWNWDGRSVVKMYIREGNSPDIASSEKWNTV